MMVNFMQLYVVSYVVRMQLDMLDNDNIMTVNAFEVVQKMPTDQKDCHKCSLYGIVSIQPQYIQQKRLDANKTHPAQLKETEEDILKFVQKKVK